MPNDKQTLFKRLAGQSGKGVGARTGIGTANVVVPEFPQLPARITPESVDRFRIAVEDWRQQLQSQFPIPLPDQFDPSQIQTQIDALIAASASASEAIAALQRAQLGAGDNGDISALLESKANVDHKHVNSDVSGLGSMAAQNLERVYIKGGSIYGHYELTSEGIRIRVVSGSAATLPKGTPVYISGYDQTTIQVDIANPSSPSTMPAIGVLLESVEPGDPVYVIVYGLLSDIDTSTRTVGAAVYVDPLAGLSTSIPQNPNLVQQIGYIHKVDVSGEVLIAGPSIWHGSMARQNSDNVDITGGIIDGYYRLRSAAVHEFAKNVSGAPIARGTPVYIVGRTGAHIDVAPADASNPAMMPAIGVTQDAIDAGSEGYIHVIGAVTDVDTSAATIGQAVYVAAGGGLTTTKPASPNLIQNIGRVAKVANNGEVLVLGPGRENDVPALANLNVFIGNVNGQAVQRRLTPSDIQGLSSGPASEDWTYRVGQAVVRSGAVDLLGETASTAAGSATNVNPDGSQLYTQNYATAVSLNADAGFASSTPHVTTADPRFGIYFRLMQTTDTRCFILLTDTGITTHLSADAPTSGNFIGFRYSSSAGDADWKVVSRDGTNISVANTGIAIDTNPHFLELRSKSGGTSFDAYIDGALVVAGITANLPSTTALLTVKAGIRALTAAAKNFRWSYFRVAERQLP